MKHIIAFGAEGIVRDAQSNNITAFNILERLSSPSFPLFFPRIFFFCLLERNIDEPPQCDFKLKVINNTETLLEIPTHSNFKDQTRNRQIIEIGGLAIPAPGNLIFTLIHEESSICSYSIEVKQIGEPQVKKIEG